MINLTKHKADIQRLNPLLTNFVRYDYEKWNKGFNNKRILAHLSEYENRKISRKTLITIYRRYYDGDVNNAFIPFLLTMIWGYDTPGYGPFRVNNFIQKENKKLISGALQTVADKNINQAFDSLMRIQGLGISFVSKILYFSSRACEISEYPLIFDQQVARALVSLASAGQLDGIVDATPSKHFKSYDNYNKLIHHLSFKLKVEPEKVEYFIFKYSSGLSNSRPNKY